MITPLRVESFNLADKAKLINDLSKSVTNVEKQPDFKPRSEPVQAVKMWKIVDAKPIEIKIFGEIYTLKNNLPIELNLDEYLEGISNALLKIVDVEKTNLKRMVSSPSKRQLTINEGKPIGEVNSITIFDKIVYEFYKEYQDKFTSVQFKNFLYGFYDGSLTKNEAKVKTYAYMRYMRDNNFIDYITGATGVKNENVFTFINSPYIENRSVRVDYDPNYSRDLLLRERKVMTDN